MSYDYILVPLDGSHLAEYILPHVKSIASAFHSQVTLLHVIESREAEVTNLTPSQRSARADIIKYLERVAETLCKEQITCEWRVTIGNPAREIVRQAAEQGIDLIMMSTRGKGERGPGAVGSVAMAVVSSGATPVMLIKPPEEVATR